MEFPSPGLQETKILANVICWGTGYQMAAVMPNKESITARDVFADLWVKHYGAPEMFVTDQGPEFVGQDFTKYVAQVGCLQHHIDSQSP